MGKNTLEKTIGENIAKYREFAGITQSELAERVGISTAFISRVERGLKMMKVHTLYATAQALNVSFYIRMDLPPKLKTSNVSWPTSPANI